MKQNLVSTKMVALDSCVVIDLIEKKAFAGKLRASLRGKRVRLVICDVVLNEVQRVRGFAISEIISKVSGRLGKKVEITSTDDDQRVIAESITLQYQFCHRGDNLILSLCRAKDFVLVTLDRMLLRACEFVGVAAFHPAMAGGI